VRLGNVGVEQLGELIERPMIQADLHGRLSDVADSWLPRSAFQDRSLALPTRIQRIELSEFHIRPPPQRLMARCSP
jgi:hypothetical protein